MEDGHVTLLPRSGPDWTAKYPSVIAALKKLNVHSAVSMANSVAWGSVRAAWVKEKDGMQSGRRGLATLAASDLFSNYKQLDELLRERCSFWSAVTETRPRKRFTISARKHLRSVLIETELSHRQFTVLKSGILVTELQQNQYGRVP